MAILANAKHEKFAQGLAVGLSKTAAWLTISPNATALTAEQSGSRLSRNVKVAARVAELNAAAIALVEKDAEEAVATAAWIVARAVRIVEIGMATTPVRDRKGQVIEDSEGEPAYYDATDLKAANSALTLLAKRHPEFRDSAPIDARSLTLVLPEGTTLDDLRKLRDGLK